MRLLPLLLAALPAVSQAEPLRIITDIPPVQSLVLQVVGDRGSVDVLLDQNADPHHFQLRPSQARLLASADALIWISEEMTPWLDRVIQANGDTLVHLPLLHEDIHTDTDQEEIDHHHEDPHFWLDPEEAVEMLDKIETKLVELDPEGAAIYAENADRAVDRLLDMEGDIADMLSGVQDIPFVVTHDGYRYFVRHFGLTQVGTLSDIHDSAASVKTVSNLAQLAETGGIKCVFGEVGESSKLAKVLVEAGAVQGDDLDPAGIAIPRGPALYETLMRNLAVSFENCLSD